MARKTQYDRDKEGIPWSQKDHPEDLGKNIYGYDGGSGSGDIPGSYLRKGSKKGFKAWAKEDLKRRNRPK